MRPLTTLATLAPAALLAAAPALAQDYGATAQESRTSRYVIWSVADLDRLAADMGFDLGIGRPVPVHDLGTGAEPLWFVARQEAIDPDLGAGGFDLGDGRRPRPDQPDLGNHPDTRPDRYPDDPLRFIARIAQDNAFDTGDQPDLGNGGSDGPQRPRQPDLGNHDPSSTGGGFDVGTHPDSHPDGALRLVAGGDVGAGGQPDLGNGGRPDRPERPRQPDLGNHDPFSTGNGGGPDLGNGGGSRPGPGLGNEGDTYDFGDGSVLWFIAALSELEDMGFDLDNAEPVYDLGVYDLGTDGPYVVTREEPIDLGEHGDGPDLGNGEGPDLGTGEGGQPDLGTHGRRPHFDMGDDVYGPQRPGGLDTDGNGSDTSIRSLDFVQPERDPDLNSDGAVDVDDLIELIMNWGACKLHKRCDGDINGDAFVDGDDLVILLFNWH